MLGANTIHADEDFAAIELLGSVLMLHADHSYLDHEMAGVTAGVEIRGAGIEIRVYGADPDRPRRKQGNTAIRYLAGSMDKPHGLRECHIVGPDGYIFVPSLAIRGLAGRKPYFNHIELQFRQYRRFWWQ